MKKATKMSIDELVKEFDVLFDKDSLTKNENNRMSNIEEELQKRQEIR